MNYFISRLILLILLAMVAFLLVRFVGLRNEFGYIGPDKSSVGYQYLLSGLNERESYISGGSLSGLNKATQYFQRANLNNQDSVLGNTLKTNIASVEQRSQLETINQCLVAIRNINQTRTTIDNSYNTLLDLLKEQITLMPKVITSVKSVSTLKCMKNYFDHLTQTSMLLITTSQSRGKQKDEYGEIVDKYPKNVGSCDQIITIQKQSIDFQQQLADAIYRYRGYRNLLDDPSRYGQFCQMEYEDNLTGSQDSSLRPSLQNLGDNIDQAIASVKERMK